MADTDWAPIARSSREALRQLGYNVDPVCLPDEAKPCGGTFIQHTVAHLAAIKAVADHQLLHTGAPAAMIDDIYQATMAGLIHG